MFYFLWSYYITISRYRVGQFFINHDLSYSVFPNVSYLTSTSLNMITRMVSVGSTQLILRFYCHRISRQVLNRVRWSILCLLPACVYIIFSQNSHSILIGRPRWLSWMRRPTETSRSRVQPPPRSATAPSDWRPGGRGFNRRRGRQHSSVEIDHEIFSTVILSLPLIQEGQLSVSGERMCTVLVNRLED